MRTPQRQEHEPPAGEPGLFVQMLAPRAPFVGPAPAVDPPAAQARPEPLRIEYTRTRVLADAIARVQRAPGVLRVDRPEVTETFRRLRSQVLQRMRSDGHVLLGVTSPRPLAGKSLVALNLALAVAAELDTTALLVDGDLGDRGLQRLFGLDEFPGLAEHLTRGDEFSTLLLNPGIDRLVVLPACAGGAQPSSELLGTRASRHLFEELKSRYADRLVIVDLPSLLHTADALAFLSIADTTLLVLEQSVTTLADLESANELLAPFNLIGAVMTPPSRAEPRLPWWRLLRRRRPTPVLDG